MKSFLRFLMRNRLYSLINFAGLTLSLALVTIIFGYAGAQRKISRSTPDYKNTYALAWGGDAMLCYGISDRLAGLPEAEAVTMFSSAYEDNVCEFGDNRFISDVMCADDEFFSFFGIEFAGGSPEHLTPTGAFISESFARRAGVGEDPLGKQILLDGQSYSIDGVFKDFSRSLLSPADIIISNEASEGPMFQYKSMPFRVFGNVQVFVRLKEGCDIGAVTDKLNELFKDTESIYGKLSLIRSDKLYFSEGNFFMEKGEPALIRNLAAAGTALLLLALLNYINLNTALVGKRSVEMATRRLLGSGRKDIFFKYIRESLTFTALCFILAIALAAALTPTLGRLTIDSESVSASALFDPRDIIMPGNILAYALTCLLTGILAGVIPASLASRVAPIDIIKGEFRRSDRRIFSKVFIVVQNVVSVTLIALTLTMELQTRHMLSRPIGCDYGDIYYLSTGLPQTDREALQKKLAQLPCVDRIGFCSGLPGSVSMSYINNVEDKEFICGVCMLDTTAFEMLRFNILNQTQECAPGSVWLTESTVKLIGDDVGSTDLTENFIGGGYMNESYGSTVCGVVSDFVSGSPGEDQGGNGLIISITGDTEWKDLVIRTKGDHADASAMIRAAYEEVCLESCGVVLPTYENRYMDDVIRHNLADELRSLRLVEILVALAILLSISGLVAISIYNTDSNAKSIAVHKVFGASSSEETRRNLRTYFGITMAADVLAVPVALVLCRRYLEDFSYRLDLSAWIFIATVLISLAITFISVIFQVRRAAGVNPAETLKKKE